MVIKSKQTGDRNAKKNRVKDGELKVKDKTLKDLSEKNSDQTPQVATGAMGTAAGFITGGGAVSAAISSAKKR